jgi:hypothetical protein
MDSPATAQPPPGRPDVQGAPFNAAGPSAGQPAMDPPPPTTHPNLTATPSPAAKPEMLAQQLAPAPAVKATSSNPHTVVHPEGSSRIAGSLHAESVTCLGVPGVRCNYNADAPAHLLTVGEFLPVIGLFLALLAVVRPKIDFRMTLAGLTPGKILGATAIAAGSVLIGALLPMWSGERWPIVGYSAPWELLAIVIVLGGALRTLFVAFRPARFSKRNGKAYLNHMIGLVARGDTGLIADLAAEIYYSVKPVVETCALIGLNADGQPARDDQQGEVDDHVRIAYTVLDLWSDERLCAAIVTRAPATGIELLTRIKTNLGERQGGWQCVRELVDQALTREDSVLYREDEFSPLGRHKQFTRAIAGDYGFVESWFRPLQGWKTYKLKSVTSRQVGKYGDLIHCALEAYLTTGDFGQAMALQSAYQELSRLSHRPAWALREIEERDVGNSGHLLVLGEIARAFEHAVREVVEREASIPVRTVGTTDSELRRDYSVYNAIARGVYDLLEGASMALRHDFVIRSSVISLWLEVFPGSDSQDSKARRSIRERLEVYLKEKVAENLAPTGHGYPAVARLLLSIYGLYRSAGEETPGPYERFASWLLPEVADKYTTLAAGDARMAKDILPEDVAFTADRNELVKAGRRGGHTVLALKPLPTN